MCVPQNQGKVIVIVQNKPHTAKNTSNKDVPLDVSVLILKYYIGWNI